LEKDSKLVQSSAAAAVSLCGVNASLVCPQGSYTSILVSEVNTTKEKIAIMASFQNSLDVVSKVANDKYFGVDDLSNTAKELNKIMSEVQKINSTMPCGQAVPTYCAIYKAGGGIVSGMSKVSKALDAFKTSDIVETWENNHDLVLLLHGLPYFMVAALAFFWLASFVIYGIVFVTGVLLTRFQDRVQIPVLKGKPSLEQAIEHIQTEYPEFWNLVFAGLVDGLSKLYASSVFFVLASIVIATYTCCECCCCPYRRKRVGEEGKPANSS